MTRARIFCNSAVERINKRNGVGNYLRSRWINSVSVIIASSELRQDLDNYSKCEDCERDSAYVKHRSESATPVNKTEPGGCKLPGVRLLSMINMTEKVTTRVNTQTPLTNFWTAKNLHGSAFSLHATSGTVKFLSFKQYCNLWRICTFPLNRLHR